MTFVTRLTPCFVGLWSTVTKVVPPSPVYT